MYLVDLIDSGMLDYEGVSSVLRWIDGWVGVVAGFDGFSPFWCVGLWVYALGKGQGRGSWILVCWAMYGSVISVCGWGGRWIIVILVDSGVLGRGCVSWLHRSRGSFGGF